jgi:hypothetical protein
LARGALSRRQHKPALLLLLPLLVLVLLLLLVVVAPGRFDLVLRLRSAGAGVGCEQRRQCRALLWGSGARHAAGHASQGHGRDVSGRMGARSRP